ncbi:MAG: sugar transferase, partial [bacterium]|nr:sugar transferase [bacterium]
PDYDERHRMPVGITGLAQIIGLRGDTSIAERIKYDNLYIDQWSFGLDLRILIKTAFAIIHQAAYASQAVELEHAIEAIEGDSYDIDLRPGAQRLAPAQPIDQEIS